VQTRPGVHQNVGSPENRGKTTRQIDNYDEGNILASNKARAYFALSGYHFNPDDITHLLGIQPTSVNAAGANSGLDKPVISSWELSTDTITDDVDVYDLTGNLIKQVEPAKEKILQAIKSHNLSPRFGMNQHPRLVLVPEQSAFWQILVLL
jgi:hypothetical protein